MIRIGVVGHRFFNDPGNNVFVVDQCNAILQKVMNKDAVVIALSPIAEGADSIFAEAAISLNIQLEIVKPFEQYARDFETQESKILYERLRKAACKETLLQHTQRSKQAYFDAMQWIVQNADILVAVWNGEHGGGKGGTADAIKYVLSSNQDWIHVNVTDHSLIYHLKKYVHIFL